jgi:hypothetical protein
MGLWQAHVIQDWLDLPIGGLYRRIVTEDRQLDRIEAILENFTGRPTALQDLWIEIQSIKQTLKQDKAEFNRRHNRHF